MKKFIDLLSSLRLAIGLLAYLALTGILSTLIPQGLAPEAYRARFAPPVAEPIIRTGFGSFFGSLPFIFPSLLFFANLSACTAKRFLRELKKQSHRRFGPDILHLGLMLLIIGSVWSYAGHKEGQAVLVPGEGVPLPDGSIMELKDFRFERYADGRPRDWVSVLDLRKAGRLIKENFELRVNHPLRHAGLTLYQASYAELSFLALKDAAGGERLLEQGQELSLEGLTLSLMAIDGRAPEAAAQGRQTQTAPPEARRATLRVSDAEGARVVSVGPGDEIGPLAVLGFRSELATGILAVLDPGYPLVFLALLLVAFGTALTFVQKLKELP